MITATRVVEIRLVTFGAGGGIGSFLGGHAFGGPGLAGVVV